tara:strand:+ start:416 stop:835 length:420 start_codon:yes stop_codon:yes gene_type:complete
MKREVNAIWKGGGGEGTGHINVQSGAFKDMPYSFKTRFENEDGKLGTNPEELIASALAGCFNMKLAFVLNEVNLNPNQLHTKALLTFQDGAIKLIELFLSGNVPNIEQEKFAELAEEAKNNCPVSGVLNCEIKLNTTLI